MPRRAPPIAGILLGAATTAVYMIGSSRSYGYDAAATFANFVATPSLWDALAVHAALPTIPLKSIASNDHVLLSLISHIVYTATGSRSEVVYRLLPAVAAGGTVGISAKVLSQKFGLLAGASAAVYIATDPLFVENSRDLRGYSLAALCALLGTILLAKTEKWTRSRLVAYGLLMGLAIAAHVFAVVVLAGHVAWIATRRSMPSLIQLAPAWLVAAVIGVAANANIEIMELLQHGFPPSLFYPTFPRDLVFFLLGAPVLLPLGLWLSTAGLGLWAQRAEPLVWASIVVIAIVVAILWLGLQPAYLYPRFFIFLVPGFAYLMAAAIARWKVLAPVVLVGAAAAAISQVPGYAQDPLALPQAAAFVERAHAAGERVCVIHSDEQVLAAYTTDFTVVSSPEQLGACDAVVVVSWNVDLGLRDLAAQEFPRTTVLQASYPAVVLERRGLSAQLVEVQHLDGAPAHVITAPAEDHSVDPPREDALNQYLPLTTMEKPADDIAHEPAEPITGCGDKANESLLRLRLIPSESHAKAANRAAPRPTYRRSSFAARMKSFSVSPPAAWVQS